MSSVVDEFLKRAAAELNDEQRHELAKRLNESLSDDPIEFDEAYEGEIQRRIEEYRAGRAKTYTSEEVRTSMLKER
jgi:putative addiction module component (TIGR02574 family)